MRSLYFFVFLVIWTPVAWAGELKECDAVDSLAVAGHFDFDIVTVHADTDDDTCRFSVNGARTGSPPQDQINDARRQLFGGPNTANQFLMQSEFPFEAMAVLLAAAGPDTDPSELENMLLNSSFVLDECVFAAGQNQPRSFQDPFGFTVECAVFPSFGDGEFFEIGPFRSISTDGLQVARMSIVVRRDAVWNLVSFPVQ